MRLGIQSSLIVVLAVGLTACSSLTVSDKVDYKKQSEVRGPNLALPPDLIGTGRPPLHRARRYCNNVGVQPSA